MKNRLPNPPLLVITDRVTAKGDIKNVVEKSLAGGCRWIMYRDKGTPYQEFIGNYSYLKNLCTLRNAFLTLNGDLTTTQKIQPDGVHLQSKTSLEKIRKKLGEKCLIGVSCHSIEEAKLAAQQGADYITLSPIFHTSSKPFYGPPLGFSGLKDACKVLDVPIIALAGVNLANANKCFLYGASGIALMSGVMGSENPKKYVSELLNSIEK